MWCRKQRTLFVIPFPVCNWSRNYSLGFYLISIEWEAIEQKSKKARNAGAFVPLPADERDVQENISRRHEGQHMDTYLRREALHALCLPRSTKNTSKTSRNSSRHKEVYCAAAAGWDCTRAATFSSSCFNFVSRELLWLSHAFFAFSNSFLFELHSSRSRVLVSNSSLCFCDSRTLCSSSCVFLSISFFSCSTRCFAATAWFKFSFTVLSSASNNSALLVMNVTSSDISTFFSRCA